MSDDRFSYIHLRSETSLWSYVDDQVNWVVENLEDRVDQSAWDLIPPYQNEDDEGILPTHSHPSYPFGNPYDMNQVTAQAPQLCPVVNQPLAVGSALLINNLNNYNSQSYWSELATEQLLRGTTNSIHDLHANIASVEQIDPQHPGNSTHQDYPTNPAQIEMRTPATQEFHPPRLQTIDATETSMSDDHPSAESAP